MTFVVQATTVLAEKTSLEDKLSKKPDYFIRDIKQLTSFTGFEDMTALEDKRV